MRKLWGSVFAAVAVVGSVGWVAAQQGAPVQPAAAVEAAPPPSGPAAAVLKQMEGYWKPESVIYDQVEQIPNAKARSLLTMVVAGGQFRTYFCQDPAKDLHTRLYTADVTLDPAARTFELAVRDGQKKGERRHGIYELNSGTLKLCYGPTDKPRPTEFSAPKGSGVFLETWAVEKR